MSIKDDVALLERIPTLGVLGSALLRMLAVGSEQRELSRGATLFRVGDYADCGFVVQRGLFHVFDGAGADVTAAQGALIGELALLVAMRRPSTATALEKSTVMRIPRSLFQRVLESDPAAAKRLRDRLTERAGEIGAALRAAGAKLGS